MTRPNPSPSAAARGAAAQRADAFQFGGYAPFGDPTRRRDHAPEESGAPNGDAVPQADGHP